MKLVFVTISRKAEHHNFQGRIYEQRWIYLIHNIFYSCRLKHVTSESVFHYERDVSIQVLVPFSALF